ncbi:MAG: arginine N-succinyltransferase [Planctomycetota bacterium]
MYRIRRAKLEDADVLLKLARMVHFINLPPDREIIAQKIAHSRNGFRKVADKKAKLEPEPTPSALAQLGQRVDENLDGLVLSGYGTSTIESDLFMFVLEDTQTGNCLGTSQTVTRMGGPGNPNVSFKLEKREFFSQSLQTGTTQMVAKMHLDDSGPTEVGGLILQPSFRGHPLKLGAFLSLVRFHWMGLHRKRFAERVLAEMMAPISSDGDSVLWDALGRRFIPLSYDEADRFCQYSREFITSLLPQGEIFLSLLPPSARSVVGEVGTETLPARRMLERLGFEYHGHVDPFDGGPYLYADIDKIQLVKNSGFRRLGQPMAASKMSQRLMVSRLQDDGEFFCVMEPATINGKGEVCVSRETLELLEAEPGERVGVTLRDGPIAKIGAAAKKKSTKKQVKKAAAKKKTSKKRAKKTTARRAKA